MVDAVESRPKVYNRHLQIQSFSLVELMHGIPGHRDPNVRRGNYYVEGGQITITPEGDNLFTFVRNDFIALRYDNTGLIVTNEWEAKVFIKSQKIIILDRELDRRSGLPKLLYGQAGFRNKMGRSAEWYYTGGMAEALAEFNEKGFRFDWAKRTSSSEEVALKVDQWEQNRKENPNQSRELPEGHIVKTNLSLDEVLEIISQKP